MLFIKVKNSNEGQNYLIKALVKQLDIEQRVAWLVSGGSNITISTEVRRKLPTNKLKNLRVALIDERYGPIGHADSNFIRFQQAGFDFSNIDFEPVLIADNLNLEQTTKDYERRLKDLLRESDVVIGQFGMGIDGHIAGILPHSQACTIDDRLVIGYQAQDFERITLSFKAIRMIDESYIFAFGENKRGPLRSLYDENQPLDDQPVHIFRQSYSKSFIINDMIGDKI